MRFLINVSDVIYEIIKQIKNKKLGSEHYLGNIPENCARPSFLYLLSFLKDTRSSYFTKDRILNIQIIYFGIKDDDGKEIFEDKLKTIEELEQFLSSFNINVKDRNLKFEYSITEVDEQLSINIDFKFKDSVINPEYDEEQTRDMIENIFINDKELS